MVRVRGQGSAVKAPCAHGHERVHALIFTGTLFVYGRRGNAFLVRQSATIVRLLANAAPTPWRPSHAGAASAASHKVRAPARAGECTDV